jgi:hypothetical protein
MFLIIITIPMLQGTGPGSVNSHCHLTDPAPRVSQQIANDRTAAGIICQKCSADAREDGS